MISAADLGLADLGFERPGLEGSGGLASSPFWRLDPPTTPTLDIHLASPGISDLTRFIVANRYDQIPNYDVFYELEVIETPNAIAEILIATTHADKTDIAGWYAVQRVIDPDKAHYCVKSSNLFVVPEFRGFGVGRALVHTALRAVKGDLLAMGTERFAPRFYTEAISPGGEALARLFSDRMRDLVEQLPGFHSFESRIE